MTQKGQGVPRRDQKDAMKPQNFKGQAEITSGFATAFIGAVSLLCVNKSSSASAEANHGKPVEI